MSLPNRLRFIQKMLKRKDASSTNETTSREKKQQKQSSLTAWIKKPSPEQVQLNITKRLSTEVTEINEDLRLEFETMDKEWLSVLLTEIKKPYFIELKKFLQDELKKEKIFPPEPEIYSWSRFTPPSSVKVVILGQDPYHNDGQAHGLCFSVPKKVRSPPSLNNIFIALEKDIPTFQKPNHGYLANWAKSGVLLLNATLTVQAHKPMSHSGKGWETFTDAVIQYLSEKKMGLVFMLWGAHAIKKGKSVNKKNHLVLTSVHPSPLSAPRGFFDCHHWSKANEYLKSKGQEEIDWNCLNDP
ncbi:6546_t:CDS:2 [Diversispora eburnea]|uniref:Uracil-DNA glycosylase n=1 Tax=Diversispora eburnea TaxID=1213867 RepID=A0A9N8V993_9GLOM|nr:6546_t:CDS:2 [Diversispora eburnea]